VTSFFLNGESVTVDDPSTPLLWVICAATPATNLPGEHMPPGNTKWSLPSPEHTMVFVGRSPAELCRRLKDSKQTDGRSLQQLLEHVSSDDLVGWAWDPGPGRTLPPLLLLDTAMQTVCSQ